MKSIDYFVSNHAFPGKASQTPKGYHLTILSHHHHWSGSSRPNENHRENSKKLKKQKMKQEKQAKPSRKPQKTKKTKVFTEIRWVPHPLPSLWNLWFFWFFWVSSKVSLAFPGSSLVFLVFLSFLEDFHLELKEIDQVIHRWLVVCIPS